MSLAVSRPQAPSPVRRLAPAALPAAAALAVIHGFWPLPLLRWATGLAVTAAVLFLWPDAHPRTRRLAALMLGVFAAASLWVPLAVEVRAAVRAGEVIAMLLGIQILSDAFAGGGYDRAVQSLLGRTRGPLAWTAGAAGYLLSWGFLVTSIPVVYTALTGGRDPHAEKVPTPGRVDLGVLLARAFGCAAVATPLQPTVALAMTVTGAAPLTFGWRAAVLSLLLLPVAMVGLRPAAGSGSRLERASPPAPADRPSTPGSGRPGFTEVGMLGGFFVTLAAAVIAVGRFPVPVLAGLGVALATLGALWGELGRALLVAEPPPRRGLLQTCRGYTAHLGDGALVIAAGSLAGGTLTETPLVGTAAAALQRIESPALAAAVALVLVVALRLAGVVPAVILLSVGPVLAATLPLDPVSMAVLLSAACALAFVFSPLSLTSAVVASLTGATPTEVGLGRQAPFLLLGSAVAMAYVAVLAGT